MAGGLSAAADHHAPLVYRLIAHVTKHMAERPGLENVARVQSDQTIEVRHVD